MPPPRKPLRPRLEPAAQPPKKKLPIPLLAGIVAGAVGLIAILFITLGGGEEPPPTPPKPPPPPPEVWYSPPRVHHVDGGRSRQVSVFVHGTGSLRPEGFAAVDEAGKEHPAAAADPLEYFAREIQAEPTGAAFSFNLPMAPTSWDLRVPGGKKHPIYRAPGKEAFKAVPADAVFDHWTLSVGKPRIAGGRMEVDVGVQGSASLDPKRLLLIADTGEVLPPDVLGRSPLRLRYALPKAARELRLQLSFRDTMIPDYLVFPLEETKEAAPAPTANPAPPPPPPPKSVTNLRAVFETKLSDPVAALKWLAEQPTADARPVAAHAVPRLVQDDLAAGLKAFEEGRADVAEKHLARAALLADPYQPEFSKQLMRMLFLLRQPRKLPTGCEACKGAGASACGTCQLGLVLGNCSRCEAKGQVNCILCDGSGKQDHHGFKGKMVLTIGDTLVSTPQGKGTLHGQVATYHFKPCNAGSFHLDTGNVITCKCGEKDPRVRPVTFNGSKPCIEFWKEFKLYAFNGRAKIQILSSKDQLVPFSSAAARRFFADYEVCKGGSLACDRCEGRKQGTCTVCSGKGKASVICSSCEGTSQKPCAACKGYGDSSWLARLLPEAPGLPATLGAHAVAIRDWLDVRARAASRKGDLTLRLAEARKGLDPTAKLSEDLVDVQCPRCRSNGSACEDCWATGRREYFAGTAQYERYVLAQRLERQLKEIEKLPGAPALDSVEAAAAVAATKPPPPPPRPRMPDTAVAIPKDVDEAVRQADAFHETGKTHLEKAKSSNDQKVWMEEAVQAVADLKKAQVLYAAAQDKLDGVGAAVPRELQDKFRINMQALMMARRTAP